jgi:hypothetical protein
VCLTDRIPAVEEFYARQDADFVACGTMYFEPGHPVMLRCLEQTMKLDARSNGAIPGRAC